MLNPILVFIMLNENVCIILNKNVKLVLIVACMRTIITVIFLQCPYFSLIIWNFLKKHPFPGSFEKDQKILEDGIILFNRKIKELNGDRAIPNLNLDFMYSIKKKGKQIKRFRNYNLLYDGIHTNTFLAKLWSLRIVRMISLIN